MRENHLWNRAKEIQIQTSSSIVGNFDIGFDRKVPEQTKDMLMRFAYWVEDHFHLPVTLWVDFKYNHYLVGDDRKRVGYRFYHVAFKTYPVFTDPDDIPVIELAVRPDHRSEQEILTAFIEAISLYYAWLTNTLTADTQPDAQEVAEVLQCYLQDRSVDSK